MGRFGDIERGSQKLERGSQTRYSLFDYSFLDSDFEVPKGDSGRAYLVASAVPKDRREQVLGRLNRDLYGVDFYASRFPFK
jgi:hypothetical protein